MEADSNRINIFDEAITRYIANIINPSMTNAPRRAAMLADCWVILTSCEESMYAIDMNFSTKVNKKKEKLWYFNKKVVLSHEIRLIT